MTKEPACVGVSGLQLQTVCSKVHAYSSFSFCCRADAEKLIYELHGKIAPSAQYGVSGLSFQWDKVSNFKVNSSGTWDLGHYMLQHEPEEEGKTHKSHYSVVNKLDQWIPTAGLTSGGWRPNI